MSARSLVLFRAITLAAIGNVFAFFSASAVLGGTALGGRVHAGHYFLSSNNVFTEVSAEQFRESRAYATVSLTLIVVTSLARLLFALAHRRGGGPVLLPVTRNGREGSILIICCGVLLGLLAAHTSLWAALAILPVSYAVSRHMGT